MKLIKTIKDVFGKSLCNICLKESRVQRFDQLNVCSDCIEKVKAMEKGMPFELSNDQVAGGIKDEL